MQKVLIKPIITEKSMAQTGQGIYTFAVETSANKKMIKKAVEGQFNVTVLDVRTLTVKGKRRMKQTKRNRITVVGSDLKKAIVQVASGQKIDLFDVGKA